MSDHADENDCGGGWTGAAWWWRERTAKFGHALGVARFIVAFVSKRWQRVKSAQTQKSACRNVRDRIPPGLDHDRASARLPLSTRYVLPGINLDERAVNDLRRQGINDAAARIVGVIRGHERFRFKAQNALQGTGDGSRLECRVNFFPGDASLDDKDAIRQTSVGQRDTHGQSIEFSL